jgi:endonuclease/exonuclease/phosphatase family metal-dependent hydrolase
MLRVHKCILFTAALCAAACDKPAEPTTAPEAAPRPAPETKAEAPEADAEKEKAPPKEEKKEGVITVATFNLAWAHDYLDDGPKAAKKNRAKSKAEWDWKVKEIAKLIAEAKPDIVALHELGGGDEADDIVSAIKDLKGPGYEWAHQDSEDTINGHQTAILSQLALSNERRFKIHLRRHVVAEVELPNGDTATLIAVHAPEGSRNKPKSARRKQTKALLRMVKKIRKKRPVIVLGTFGSNIAPSDDGYDESAVGMLTGANTSTDDDDCDDSSAAGAVGNTTSNELLADRIIGCGLPLFTAKSFGSDKIVREEVDPWDKPWSEVPVDKPPHRDVSDHFMVIAEIKLPKPEKKAGEGADKKKDAGADKKK